jgi:hypothetical protein
MERGGPPGQAGSRIPGHVPCHRRDWFLPQSIAESTEPEGDSPRPVKLSIWLYFKAENRALRPLRVADGDFRVPCIRDAHRPQRNAHVEEVVSGLNQRIGL